MAPDRQADRLNIVRPADESDPRLLPYRNQKDAWLRAQRAGGTGLADGLFLAEGEIVVRTLLDSPHRTLSVLCTQARLLAMTDALARLGPETPVFVADRPLLERIVGFDLHRGILALGARTDPPTAADLLARARLLVLCEDIANHDNLGAIFRNTACLVGSASAGDALVPAAVLLSPRCCDPLYRKALRVSMGHALRVPFARLEQWPRSLEAVKLAGFRLLALSPDPAGKDMSQAKQHPIDRLALLVGAEGPGLSPEALAAASERIRIPMAPGADSLNVATALAIALSHLST
jgi:tRNA G18 (ribose-2'-O)-methylase SpoU